MSLNFDVDWIHGAPDCRHSNDPALQTHRADRNVHLPSEQVFELRSPVHVSPDGSERSLAHRYGCAGFRGDSRCAPRWMHSGAARSRPARRITSSSVTHTHMAITPREIHSSRAARRPPSWHDGRTRFRRTFAIDEWPDGIGSLDLGDRVLTVIPIPDTRISTSPSTTARPV